MIWELSVMIGDRYLRYTAETVDGFPYCNSDGFYKARDLCGEVWVNSRHVVSIRPKGAKE